MFRSSSWVHSPVRRRTESAPSVHVIRTDHIKDGEPVGRNRLNGAAALTALLAASALALSACSSSGSSGANTSAPPTTQTSSSSSSSGSGASGISCTTGTLNGSGSTAQTNAMDAWRKAYQEACSGAKINYDSIGSGDGISAFTDKKADFAGSDAALDPKAEMP